MRLEQVPAPVPGDNEILIEVRALSLNPAEWHLLNASIWMLRLSSGLARPGNPILGAGLAGVVVETGKNVQVFTKGDRIMGRTDTGGLAEMASLAGEGKINAVIDRAYSFEEIPRAFAYLGSRRVSGKLIAIIEENKKR